MTPANANAKRLPPPDQTTRQDALNPRRSFIVQAPAGSGKTELLVRRYLALLAKVDAPEQILAITFTRKATAEMRLRIIRALKRIKADGSAEDDAELLALANAARDRDEKNNWRIIENTRRLRIQTIDAFCNELVWRMPWSARFGSPPNLVEDAAPLCLIAAKRALDNIEDDKHPDWSDACRQLLALVDADWNKAQTLLADMLMKRDKWMRLLGPADREHVEQMWRQSIDRELQVVAVPPAQQTELLELGAFAAGNLIASGKESPVPALHEAQHFPEANHQYIDQWHALAALALTGTGSVRRTVTKTQGFPTDKKNEKARMLELLNQLTDQPDLVDALIKIRALPQGTFSDAQWHSIDALVKLLRLAAAELRVLFKERNQSDYIELTQRAEMALGEPDNPSNLALAFDYQLQHLLMDEFQDTSTAHIELLTRLTAGWQRDDGRTLFFVGDPMQSIYRFREAEVANFLQVKADGLGDLRLESLTLEANFRSAKPLVEWFNDTFAEVLPERDDIVNGAVCYARALSHLDNKQAGEVRVHPGVNGNIETEAQSIVTLIEQTQQQDEQPSIAVLGRTRRHLSAIAATLREQGIAFRGRDLEKLNDRPAIRDLLAITRALAQPADRIAWLSLLRAPWCGLSLADIATLAGADHSATLLELERDDEQLAALSSDGKIRLRRLCNALAAALERRGRIGLRQNVEAAWLALGGPATIDEADLDDCQRYLDLLAEMENEQIEITAASLKKATDNLWAHGGSDAQVELLTIHKAKGLEFDTVILPQLNGRTRGADKPLLRWRKLPEELLIAPLPSSADKDDAFYQYLADLELRHEQNEAGRLLYVACTRAKKNLHLFGNVATDKNGAVKAPTSSSLLWLLWPLVYEQFDEAAATAGDDDANANETTPFQPRPLQRLPHEWRLPDLPPGINVETDSIDAIEQIEFSWAGETARITGIVIHQILQQVDADNWEQWCNQAINEKQKSQWRNKLIENGIAESNINAALEQVTNAIDNARRDPKAAWIFSNAHRDIKTEWPLTGKVDGRIVHIIIDRSFTDQNGTRWIIDFKSGRHEGANPDEFLDREQERHQSQMSRYATVVGQLQAGEIKLGLYFPALPGWREWVG